jgi:hypothetical protein
MWHHKYYPLTLRVARRLIIGKCLPLDLDQGAGGLR